MISSHGPARNSENIHCKPANPLIHGHEYDSLTVAAQETDLSVAGEKAVGFDTGIKSPSSLLLGMHSGKVLIGLNPSTLALVKKLPEKHHWCQIPS